MDAPRTNSTVLSTSPFLTTPESSVPPAPHHHVREGRTTARGERGRVSRSLSRDALRRLDRDVQSLNDTVLRASATATNALVQQAQDLPDPVRRPPVKLCRTKDQNNLMLYEYEHHHVLDDAEDEGEAAVDDDVVLAKPTRRHSSSLAAVPRLAGYAILQATVDEFEATFAHRNPAGTLRLSEDMVSTELLYTVTEESHKRISIQRLVLQPRGVGGSTRRRDFIVVECQKRFKLHDGRQGWVQSVHSVDVPTPTSHGGACVRGAIHRSGIVAIESTVHKKTLDVVVTAQLDLHGSASTGALRAVSKRRVLKVLHAVHETLVTHRVEAMSFPATHRFREIEFGQKNATCHICADKLWRCRIPGWKAARYACRKCGGTVCGSCSHVWEIERQRTTTLVGGGRVMTATRVCTQCFMQPHASAGVVEAAVPRNASGVLGKSGLSALLRPRSQPQAHPKAQLQPTAQPHTTAQPSRNSERATSLLAHSQLDKLRRPSGASNGTELPMRPTQLEFHLPSFGSERSFDPRLAPSVASPIHEHDVAYPAYDTSDDDSYDSYDDDDDVAQDPTKSMKTIRLATTSMKTIRLDGRSPSREES